MPSDSENIKQKKTDELEEGNQTQDSKQYTFYMVAYHLQEKNKLVSDWFIKVKTPEREISSGSACLTQIYRERIRKEAKMERAIYKKNEDYLFRLSKTDWANQNKLTVALSNQNFLSFR